MVKGEGLQYNTGNRTRIFWSAVQPATSTPRRWARLQILASKFPMESEVFIIGLANDFELNTSSVNPWSSGMWCSSNMLPAITGSDYLFLPCDPYS